MQLSMRTGVYRPLKRSGRCAIRPKEDQRARRGVSQGRVGRRCKRQSDEVAAASRLQPLTRRLAPSGMIARRNAIPTLTIPVGVGGLCAFAPASPSGIKNQETTIVHRVAHGI